MPFWQKTLGYYNNLADSQSTFALEFAPLSPHMATHLPLFMVALRLLA